ncbi:MAG: FRG domain-containing protein [Bacteroidota bacterium]
MDPTPIKTISDLIDQLKKDSSGFEGPIWYRGQANHAWNLEPRYMRIKERPPETYFINKFKQDASIILGHQPKSEFDWLFLMQHYGVATRLLDWSESPLVALFFALGNSDVDGSLWVLYPTNLNKMSNYEPEFTHEIPSFEDVYLENYKPSTIVGEKKSNLLPMAAIAPRNSSRMQAQQGVFTISHRNNIFINEAGPEGVKKNHAWRYMIPKECKDQFMQELRLLGYNRFQLFPELESIADSL